MTELNIEHSPTYLIYGGFKLRRLDRESDPENVVVFICTHEGCSYKVALTRGGLECVKSRNKVRIHHHPPARGYYFNRNREPGKVYCRELNLGYDVDSRGYLTRLLKTSRTRVCCSCGVRYSNEIWELNKGKDVHHAEDHEKMLVWSNHLDDAEPGIIKGCFIHEKGQEHVRSHWEGQVVIVFAKTVSEQRKLTEEMSASGGDETGKHAKKSTKKTYGGQKVSSHSHGGHGPGSTCFDPPIQPPVKPSANFVFGSNRFGLPGPSSASFSASKSQASTSGLSRPSTVTVAGPSTSKNSGMVDLPGPWRLTTATAIDLPNIIVTPHEESEDESVHDDFGQDDETEEDMDSSGSPPLQSKIVLLDSTLEDDVPPAVCPRAELCDINQHLRLKYSVGTKDKFEALDLTGVSYNEALQTALLNGMLVCQNAHWALLVSLLICLMGSNGISLLQRQLCQLCFRTAFLRTKCGHCGLCVNCGGDENDQCLQCSAVPNKIEKKLLAVYKEGEKIANTADGRSYVCAQMFCTNSTEHAAILVRIMEIVESRGGILSQKDWDKIKLKLDTFDRRTLKVLRTLNPLLAEIPFADDDDQNRCVLFTFLLARTECKCPTCPERNRTPMNRIILRQCNHSESCYDCIKENDETCKQNNCRSHLRYGSIPVEHSVVLHRN